MHRCLFGSLKAFATILFFLLFYPLYRRLKEGYSENGVLYSATEDSASNLKGQLQSLASKTTHNHTTREQK